MKQAERFLVTLAAIGLLMQPWGVRQALPVIFTGIAALMIFYVALLFTGWRKSSIRDNSGRAAEAVLLLLVLAGIGLQAMDYSSFAYESIAVFFLSVFYVMMILLLRKQGHLYLLRLLFATPALGLQLLIVVFFAGK